MNIRAIARLLSGEVAGPGRILCPGPGHSPGDRSLSITLTLRTSAFETTTFPEVDGHSRAARTCSDL